MIVKSKRLVDGWSGHCRHARNHRACHAMWETPSSIVTCGCECHGKAAAGKIVAKTRGSKTGGARGLVAKS